MIHCVSGSQLGLAPLTRNCRPARWARVHGALASIDDVKGYARLAGFAPDQVNGVDRPAHVALPRG